MPTTSTYLHLLSGATDLNLNDNNNYRLRRDAWAPVVPSRNRATLTGEGSYLNVVEEIEIDVLGTSAAQALQNLASLTALLDQAEAWSDEEAVGLSSVRLAYQPKGSALSSVLEAIILGRAPGDQTSGVQLPVSFNQVGNYYCIERVRIRLFRRHWTGAADAATSGAARNGTIQTATFAAGHATPSPITVALGGFTPSAVPSIPASLLLITSPGPSSSPGNARLALVEAENMGPAGAFTVVAAAAAEASNGSILRYTPTATTKQSALVATVSNFEPTARRIAVFAMLKNNSSSVSYRVSATVASTYLSLETSEQIVDGSSTQARPIFLGTITHPTGKINSVRLNATASATGSSIEFDYVALLAIDDASGIDLALDTAVLPTAATNYYLTVDPRRTTAPESLVALADTATVPPDGTANIVAVSARGDAGIELAGQSAQVLWMAASSNRWCVDTATGPLQISLNLTRYRTYLTPQ